MIDENENNHNNTELTVEERRRLDALSREMTPPPELEDQTIQTLARSGLLARRPRWWVGVSALVASVLIFLTGFTLGAQTDRSAVAPSGRQYVLFLYEEAGFEKAPPDDPDQRVREYGQWVTEIRETGHFAGGERLADYGWVLAGSDDGIGVDQRLLEAPEGVVSGYFLINAASDDDALAIAESHPHLRRGGRIALRAIDPTS